MTDQQTQRYRPLAVGEVREKGDEFWNVKEERWELTYCVGVAVLLDDCRRPIPETNWREPVGEAGYPYPPGTVVQEMDCGAFPRLIILDDWKVEVFSTGDVYKCVRQQIHRVIDYRPDMLGTEEAEKTDGDEVCHNGMIDDPLKGKQETCRKCNGYGCKPKAGVKKPEPAPPKPEVETRPTSAPPPKKGWPSFARFNSKLCEDVYGDWVRLGDYARLCNFASGMEAELTRLRAEVERLTKSNQNWERLSFASANTADTTRDEIEKLRAEVKEYKTSAEIIRDFADLYKQERDEARAEVDRLTAKLAKYQPSEYQSIDLTESTVFVGAAWSEEMEKFSE